LLIAVIVHSFNYDRDYHLGSDEVLRIERTRSERLAHV